MRDANMFDVVRVSSQRLIGEIIEIHGDEAYIQVYEETSGLDVYKRQTRDTLRRMRTCIPTYQVSMLSEM